MRLRNILKVWLVFWKSEPLYAYKRYVYKKQVYHLRVLAITVSLRWWKRKVAFLVCLVTDAGGGEIHSQPLIRKTFSEAILP